MANNDPQYADSVALGTGKQLDRALCELENLLRHVLDDRILAEAVHALHDRLMVLIARLAWPMRDLGPEEPQQPLPPAGTTDPLAAAVGHLWWVHDRLTQWEQTAQPTSGDDAFDWQQLRSLCSRVQCALRRRLVVPIRLSQAQLCVLIDGRPSATEFQDRLERLLHSNVDMIQLRDKRMGDRELLGRAHMLADLARQHPALVIVNDRPDIAGMAGADGVHLGQDDLPPAAARQLLGPDKLVGVSTHSIDEVREAVLDGADYIGVGPTFPSRTKQFDHFPGLEFVRQTVQSTSIPAFAIGGIDAGNVVHVLEAGARRVAVSRAVWNAQDPGLAASALKAQLAAAVE